MEKISTAIAHPNIALIKYWGNRDHAIRLPSNGSISINLEELHTITSVTWKQDLHPRGNDQLTINGKAITGEGLRRITQFLDLVRKMVHAPWQAEVDSVNNFPAGAGIASSASAFAALALAATAAAKLDLTEGELSCLARRGSGSACRSVPGGYVEWKVGDSDWDSYAISIASPQHWSLADVIAIISTSHKSVGSTEGHILAGTSPLQESRLAGTPRRLDCCRTAVLQRDFDALARVTEEDSTWMHAVMMTSSPPLFYRQQATLTVIQAVRAARARGLPACTTVDAGPNVHIICEHGAAKSVADLVRNLPGVVEVRTASVGGAARLLTQPMPDPQY